MKRLYIGGALLSGILHAPLLAQEEYGAFLLSTLLWPLPALVWSDYVRYVMYNSYKHAKMYPENIS